jgi:hypothetical protein
VESKDKVTKEKVGIGAKMIKKSKQNWSDKERERERLEQGDLNSFLNANPITLMIRTKDANSTKTPVVIRLEYSSIQVLQFKSDLAFPSNLRSISFLTRPN